MLALGHTLQLDATQLLAAARRGDAAAQGRLFEAHKTAVARQVMRMTGDASSVDDLVQEVFVAAFRRLHDFRGDAQIETWLFRITINKVNNWLEAKRRRAARERRAAPHPDAMVTSTPDDDIAAKEQLQGFYRALHDLPAEYRDAFVARAIEHQSLRATSESLGIPVSTVSYRARRAEQMLVEALGLEDNQ